MSGREDRRLLLSPEGRSRPEGCRAFAGIAQGAARERKAAASDAPREAVAKGGEARDALVEFVAPAADVTGDAITRAGVQEPGLQVTLQTQVVVFRYPPVAPGGSKRLRFTETYVDADRYRIEGGELVWRRSLGRAYNVVVLPTGWALSASSMPATVTTQADGRVRLEFTNARPDEIDTVITAHRR